MTTSGQGADIIPITDAPSARQDRATIVDAEGNELRAPRPAPEGMMRGEEMIEKRVRLTRAEFAAVAAGKFPAGATPENGPPTTTIIDKRGRNNVYAQEQAAKREAERHIREQQRQAQESWTRQAAGTMWWAAQSAGARGDGELAERCLAKRAELVDGATKAGILTS